MQSTETKGLEEKLDDETSVSAGFSGIKKRPAILDEIREKLVRTQIAHFGDKELCPPDTQGAFPSR